MKKYLLIANTLFLLTSCEYITLFDRISGTGEEVMTESEMAAGLKEALILGIKTAAFTLNDTNGSINALGEITGYLANELVKILLPDDAEKAFETVQLLSLSSAGQALLTAAGIDLHGYREAIIRGLNRGAEHAAGTTVDIFSAAIKDLTFGSARDILLSSDSLAATHYLESRTIDTLTAKFKPIIDQSFGYVKVSAFGIEYSVKSLWSEFVHKYNAVAGAYQNLVAAASSPDIVASTAASVSLAALRTSGISSVEPVNTDLVDYATGKALKGLFFMIGRQELKIRRDPAAALAATADFVKKEIGDLIERVFTFAK